MDVNNFDSSAFDIDTSSFNYLMKLLVATDTKQLLSNFNQTKILPIVVMLSECFIECFSIYLSKPAMPATILSGVNFFFFILHFYKF